MQNANFVPDLAQDTKVGDALRERACVQVGDYVSATPSSSPNNKERWEGEERVPINQIIKRYRKKYTP